TAAMDVSDGLALDLSRMCEASGTGVRVNEREIPLGRAALRLARLEGRRPIEAASGGDDFELLFTVPAGDVDVVQEASRRARIPLTPVGVMTPADEGMILVRDDGAEEPLSPGGFDHFRRAEG